MVNREDFELLYKYILMFNYTFLCTWHSKFPTFAHLQYRGWWEFKEQIIIPSISNTKTYLAFQWLEIHLKDSSIQYLLNRGQRKNTQDILIHTRLTFSNQQAQSSPDCCSLTGEWAALKIIPNTATFLICSINAKY